MSKVVVYCSTCQEYIDEEKVEFVDIEESMIGEDILIFICPKCKKRKRSRRLG